MIWSLNSRWVHRYIGLMMFVAYGNFVHCIFVYDIVQSDRLV